jgi:hypothetical protein
LEIARQSDEARRQEERNNNASKTPDIRQSKGVWFDHFDGDGVGVLTINHIVDAMVTTMRSGSNSSTMSEAELRLNLKSSIDSIWCVFVPSGDHFVTRESFLSPSGLGTTLEMQLGAN